MEAELKEVRQTARKQLAEVQRDATEVAWQLQAQQGRADSEATAQLQSNRTVLLQQLSELQDSITAAERNNADTEARLGGTIRGLEQRVRSSHNIGRRPRRCTVKPGYPRHTLCRNFYNPDRFLDHTNVFKSFWLRYAGIQKVFVQTVRLNEVLDSTLLFVTRLFVAMKADVFRVGLSRLLGQRCVC